MTHRTHRLRVRAGHLTATGPVTPTRSHERWGRAEAARTALGEALVIHRRTRVRFPPPPHWGAGESRNPSWRKGPGAAADSGGPGPFPVVRRPMSDCRQAILWPLTLRGRPG